MNFEQLYGKTMQEIKVIVEGLSDKDLKAYYASFNNALSSSTNDNKLLMILEREVLRREASDNWYPYSAMKLIYKEDINKAVANLMDELEAKGFIRSEGSEVDGLYNDIVKVLEEHFDYPDYKDHN